ncbi:hypothetical protein Goari_015142, partial [Gossypium aridum]|nr:hypothetical protein [Gossypium aridum]
NLLHVQEINTPNRYGGIEYLGFEKLTFFPIQATIEHTPQQPSTMTSQPCTEDDCSMFTSKTPHFFKKFCEKIWKPMSSPVKLEVPSCAIWQVELTKITDEQAQLQSG